MPVSECLVLKQIAVFERKSGCVISVVPLGSGEMKYKLYGSVLVIGGGLAFQGAAAMLQARLELQLPTLINRSSQTVEVFSNPRVRLSY